METPDQNRCNWTIGVGQGDLRCALPASLSTSNLCVFHRNAAKIDAAAFVRWSHDCTPEQYVERAKAFMYGGDDPPVIRELRVRIAASKARAAGRTNFEEAA